VPQLNVYLPDDLAAALQRHRDRLNLSQICARALRQEVQRMESGTQAVTTFGAAGTAGDADLGATRSGPPDMQRLLERLRGQKERQAAAHRDGADDAARWMEAAATIDEIRRLGQWTVETEPGWLGGVSVEEATDAFYAHFTRRFEREMAERTSKPADTASWYQWYARRREEVQATGANPNEYWPAYVRGWHQSVVTTWNEIKDQL
jgi:hypothetical protein